MKIPPSVVGLSLVSLFNDFASEMVYPLLPAFVTVTLGGGATVLGSLDGAADLVAALMKWTSGRLSDRRRWRRGLILGGYLSAILIRPLISVAGAAWQVVGFRVIDRIGKGIRTPPRDAMIAEVTTPTQRGRAYGFHRGADHLGAVLGSLLAWYLLRGAFEVRQVIAWSVLPGIIAFLVLAVVLKGQPPVPPSTASPGPGAPSTDARGRVFWVPLLVLAALVLFRVPEALLLLRLQQLGVSIALVPLVWAGLHVVRSLASYPGGWLSDHLGPRRTVAAGSVVFGGVMLGLGWALPPGKAVGVFLVLGLAAGLTEAAERLLISRLAPVRTGRGFGAYHGLTGFAALPAAAAFGALFEYASPALALRASAAGMALATALWLAVAERTVPLAPSRS